MENRLLHLVASGRAIPWGVQSSSDISRNRDYRRFLGPLWIASHQLANEVTVDRPRGLLVTGLIGKRTPPI
jgi:hypothetical protein